MKGGKRLSIGQLSWYIGKAVDESCPIPSDPQGPRYSWSTGDQGQCLRYLGVLGSEGKTISRREFSQVYDHVTGKATTVYPVNEEMAEYYSKRLDAMRQERRAKRWPNGRAGGVRVKGVNFSVTLDEVLHS